MSLNNKKEEANKANSNTNKIDLLPSTNSSNVANASSSSAKPKKGDFVMFTNETLPSKTKKKSSSVSKKTPSKETSTLTLKKQPATTVSNAATVSTASLKKQATPSSGPITLKEQASQASSNATSEKVTTLNSDTSFTAAPKDQALSTSASTLKTSSNDGSSMGKSGNENSEMVHQSQDPRPGATQKRVELSEVDINILSTSNSKTKTDASKRTRTEMESTSLDEAAKTSVVRKKSAKPVAKATTSTELNEANNTSKDSKAKTIINKSGKSKEKLSFKEITELFDSSTNGDGLQPLEISSANIEAQLITNQQIASELKNSLPNSNLGITLVWESKEHGIRLFAPFAFLYQEELTDMSEVEKVLATNPKPKQSEDDTSTKLSKIKPFGFHKIMQFHDKIEELFNKDQKSFQTVGKGSKFHPGDYFISNTTNKFIRALPCALHKVISLTCVLTLLQAKAVECGILKMRAILMANVKPDDVQLTNRLSTVDGYYFAEDCYSMNISDEMSKKYIQLCKMISPEFYDIMGVNLVNYRVRLTNSQMQAVMTKLGVVYKQETQVENIRNIQLRKYLNTIHNYFLNKRIDYSTGNTYSELVDAYDTLIKSVKTYNSTSNLNIKEEKLKSLNLTRSLNVDNYDIVVSPNASIEYCKFTDQNITKNGKALGDKILFFEKNRQDEMQKGFKKIDEMLAKKDQIIHEQGEIIKRICTENSIINQRIEASLSKRDFVENTILQLTSRQGQMTEDMSAFVKNAQRESTKATNKEDSSEKIVSLLQTIVCCLKANSSNSQVEETLSTIEQRIEMADQKMNEITASLKSINLANDL